MIFDIVIQIGTVISIVVGIFAFIYGVRSYKNQMNAQVFLQYTERYEDIMKSFPKSAWSARFNSKEALPKESEELTLSVLRYLNLCSEEFYLFKQKYLSKKVWNIWADELARTLRTPLLRREWQKLADEFDAYPEFQSFVKAKQG
jgi:hypothetical protein